MMSNHPPSTALVRAHRAGRRCLHPLVGVFAASLLVVAAGCNGNEPTPPPKEQAETPKPEVNVPPPEVAPAPLQAPKIIKDEGTPPGPEAVLAKAGTLEVSLADFETMTSRGLLFSPEAAVDGKAPISWFTQPHMQLTLTQNVLHSKLIHAEFERRKIKIPKEAREQIEKGHPRLAHWYGMDADARKKGLAAIGMTEADLEAVTHEIAESDTLRDVLVKEAGDEAIWEIWSHKQDNASVVVAFASNVPTGPEIDEFVAAEGPRIEAFFEKNKRRFRTPKTVLVDILRPVPTADRLYTVLYGAAKELKGKESVTVLAKNLGMKAESKVGLLKKENPVAFGAAVGETGFEEKGPRGAYAWRVVGVTPSIEAKLSDALRREIAAEILRTETLSPSVKTKLEHARSPLGLLKSEDGQLSAPERKAVGRKLGQLGLSFRVVDMLVKGDLLPGFGLAEEVNKAIFLLDEKEPVSLPILSRERGFVVRLMKRNKPTRKKFKKHIKALREAYGDQVRARILERLVHSTLQDTPPSFDVMPLRIKYGVMQKPKNPNQGRRPAGQFAGPPPGVNLP